MNNLIRYFDCGYVTESNKSILEFVVTIHKDLSDKIMPIFAKYPILGSKAQNYQDFKKVVDIMRNKDHLTQAGLEQVLQIKAGMNRKRVAGLRGTVEIEDID
jgi:hypothetical protein